MRQFHYASLVYSGRRIRLRPHGTDICICGDNLVSDLNKEDWYEMSQRADGLWFLIGFQQAILFRGANQ